MTDETTAKASSNEKGRGTPFVLGLLRGFGLGSGMRFPDDEGPDADVEDRTRALAETLRLRIAREWLASYDDVRHPDYAFADRLLGQRGVHEGDCPLAKHPIPATCSACVVDDALAFADRILGEPPLARGALIETPTPFDPLEEWETFASSIRELAASNADAATELAYAERTIAEKRAEAGIV